MILVVLDVGFGIRDRLDFHLPGEPAREEDVFVGGYASLLERVDVCFGVAVAIGGFPTLGLQVFDDAKFVIRRIRCSHTLRQVICPIFLYSRGIQHREDGCFQGFAKPGLGHRFAETLEHFTCCSHNN